VTVHYIRHGVPHRIRREAGTDRFTSRWEPSNADPDRRQPEITIERSRLRLWFGAVRLLSWRAWW
jgi:hypothetical protein